MGSNDFHKWHGFECAIISPPELEKVCIEIVTGNRIVAWILDERDRPELRIWNTPPPDESWLFDSDDFLAYTRHATHCLLESRYGEPCVVCDDLKAEAETHDND